MRRTLRLVLSLVAIAGAPAVAHGQQGTHARPLGDRVAGSVREYPQLTIFDDVNVDVDTGAVTLSGCVTTSLKREELGARVARIDGVARLVNNLHVLPSSRADADLRVRVAQAIYGHPAFWPYASMARPPIHIIVEGGVVTLTGAVSTDVARSLACALAQVPGASAVRNQLRVER